MSVGMPWGSRLVVCRLACWSGCWRQEPHQARTDIAARGLTLPVPCPPAAGGGCGGACGAGCWWCHRPTQPRPAALPCRHLPQRNRAAGADRWVWWCVSRCAGLPAPLPALQISAAGSATCSPGAHACLHPACLHPLSCAQQACPLTVRTGLHSCAERAHMHTSLRRALQACPPRVRRRLWRRRMRCTARESTRCL